MDRVTTYGISIGNLFIEHPYNSLLHFRNGIKSSQSVTVFTNRCFVAASTAGFPFPLDSRTVRVPVTIYTQQQLTTTEPKR
jgi:hypothetical protein